MRLYIGIWLVLYFSSTAYCEENSSQSCKHLPGPTKPSFTAAYKASEHDGAYLYFSPFYAIDWKSKAPEKIINFNTKNPSITEKELIQKNRYYEAYSALSYKAPLDCTTNIGTYYFISKLGIYPIDLLHLQGRAEYFINGDMISLQQYIGYIVFSPPLNEINEGGFVMLFQNTKNTLRFIRKNTKPKFTAKVEGEKVTYNYQTSNKKFHITVNRNQEYNITAKIKSMYSFHVDADYIFVIWENRVNGCKFNATLFRAKNYGINPYLDIISRVSYGCGWL